LPVFLSISLRLICGSPSLASVQGTDAGLQGWGGLGD
jgi:hypothetical protein